MDDPTTEMPARRPVPAAIAVVVRGDSVLLVRRANPPDAGLWGFPGGKVAFGEAIDAAALRELYEETGVTAIAHRPFAALDAFDLAEDGGVRQHFLLIAVLCQWQAGMPVAGDDATDVRWVPLADLDRGDLPLSRDVAAVARQGAEIASRDVGP